MTVATIKRRRQNTDGRTRNNDTQRKRNGIVQSLGGVNQFFFPDSNVIYIYICTYCTYTQKAIKGIGRPAVQQ
jgi:hypothetical protein